jgi:hypothetical protein
MSKSQTPEVPPVSLIMSDHPHVGSGPVEVYNLEALPHEVITMIEELARRSSLRTPEHQAIISNFMTTLTTYWMPVYLKHAKAWCATHGIDHNKILNMDGDMVFSYRYPELHKAMVTAGETGVRNHCVNAKRIINLGRDRAADLALIFGEPLESYEAKLDETILLFNMVDVIGRF